MKCVPTGIGGLDAVIYGWQPTLCLLGADPGVGKSATLVRSAYNGACKGIKSAFFSLEDPPSFISTRLVSSLARVEILRILYGKLTNEELAKVEAGLELLGRVSDNIITIDGSERAMAVERLCSVARSLVSSSGVQCVYVDHAGELCSVARDRHDLEVAGQLSALRGLANATGVPVVVAMHMKRRLNSKPTLSDFANSSGAERKARLALALTREPGADLIQAHILKQTNGPSGISIDLQFDKESGMVA
jgi:replicative DNA helicase